MERIITYQISSEENGLKVEQYLRRKCYSRQNLTELKRMPESILVNGVWYHMNERLNTGDTLMIHIQETGCSEKIPAIDIPLDILYEDEDLIVINKPAGMPIHPSMGNYHYSLANGLAYYYQQQNKPFIFRCSNRLDRDTSGLTVIAKHLISASILSTMGAAHQIKREYLAIVNGHPLPEEGIIDAPLARKGTSLVERMVDYEHGERAVTHYKVISSSLELSLIRLILETGRTHQIRVHMKYLGYPLIGDYLYNPDMREISRQALHSHRLTFQHPISGEVMDFSAPLPEDMQTIVNQFSITNR